MPTADEIEDEAHGKIGQLIENAMIVATALTCKLKVVTRNVGDFHVLGVPKLNLFKTAG